MTLETIARIETALNINLIGAALSSPVVGYATRVGQARCLNDGEDVTYGTK